MKKLKSVEYEILEERALKDKLRGVLQRPEGVIAVDTETTGINDVLNIRVKLIQLYKPEWDKVLICYWERLSASSLQLIRDILQNEQILKIFHNAQYDMLVLKNMGIEVKYPIYDTMIADRIISGGDYRFGRRAANLRDVTAKRLNLEIDKDPGSHNWSGELTAQQLNYSAIDVWVLPKIRLAQLKMNSMSESFLNLECATLFPYVFMKRNGIKMLEEDETCDIVTKYFDSLYRLEDRLKYQFGVTSLNQRKKIIERLKAEGYEFDSISKETLMKSRLPLARDLCECKRRRSIRIEKTIETLLDRKSRGRIHIEYGGYNSAFSVSPSRFNLYEITMDNVLKNLFIPEPNHVYIKIGIPYLNFETAGRLVGFPFDGKRTLKKWENHLNIHRSILYHISTVSVQNYTPEDAFLYLFHYYNLNIDNIEIYLDRVKASWKELDKLPYGGSYGKTVYGRQIRDFSNKDNSITKGVIKASKNELLKELLLWLYNSYKEYMVGIFGWRAVLEVPAAEADDIISNLRNNNPFEYEISIVKGG